ncbi:hypothetical protein Gotur_007728 [Gossypium turneri]
MGLEGDGKKRGSIISNSEGSYKKMRNYCEFHHEVGHEIQECEEFKALVQGMTDNKEMEFCVKVKKEGSICTSESMTEVPKVNYPVVVILQPKNNRAGVQRTLKIII